MNRLFIYFGVLAISLVVCMGCQKEDVLQAASCTVTYDVQVPDACLSKAIGDEAGVKTLYYQAFEGKDITADQDIDPISSGMVSITGASTTVAFQLINNQSYTILFWADCSELENDVLKVDSKKYNTEDLRRVSLAASEHFCNDESLVAFYYKDTIDSAAIATPTVSLSRAVAQINILSLPYKYSEEDVIPGQSSMTVNGVSTDFNLLTGYGETVVNKEYKTAQTNRTETMTAGGITYNYAAMSYVFVPCQDCQVSVSYSLTPVYKNGSDSNFAIEQKDVAAVEIERNHRTNLFGAMIEVQ